MKHVLMRLEPTINRLSHPAGVRGLKRQYQAQLTFWHKVAPRRGAWIETLSVSLAVGIGKGVAPRRGAWIETVATARSTISPYLSHPAGVRGLKPPAATQRPLA